MLINSSPFEFTTFDAAIKALEALPTAFSGRTAVSTAISYASAKAYALHNAGVDALSQGQATGDKEKLKAASEAFRKAASKSAYRRDYLARAEDLLNYGKSAYLMGDYAEASSSLEKAAKLFLQKGSLDYFATTIGHLYKALHTLSEQPQGHTKELDRKMADVGKQALWAVENRKHEPVNPDAWRVEQNEIGFSDKAPIGTDNVCDCVCLIVRDPITHKTAIVHTDFHTDAASLQQLFDRMPATKLEVRLVGACFGAGEKEKQLTRRSIENMKKVTDFLATKNVDILSTDIYDDDQPHALVVDPETGAVTEQRPGKDNPDKYIANTLPLVGCQGKSLHVAFDLTRSPERAPHLLTAHEVAGIINYSHQTPQQLYEDSIKRGVGLTQAAKKAEVAGILVKAHQDAVAYLTDIADQQIAKKEQSGITVLPEQREAIIQALGCGPLHVGTGANDFNRPLADFIKTGLFMTPQGSTSCVINIDGLQEVKRGAIPYEKIEAASRRSTRTPSPKKTEALHA